MLFCRVPCRAVNGAKRDIIRGMAEEREIDIVEMFGPRMARDLEDVWRAHKELSESVAQAYKPFYLFIEQQAEIHRRVAEALTPVTRDAEEITKTMQPFINEWARMQELVQNISLPVLTMPSTALANYRVEELIEYIPRPMSPTLIRLDNYTMDTIVEKVVVLLKSDAPKISTPEGTIPTSVVPMPEGAKWEDVEFAFMDGHTLKISHKEKLLGLYDYAVLGFAKHNTRDKSPDYQWKFLEKLSLLLEFGSMKPTTQNLAMGWRIKVGACEKRKESLSKKLQTACGISDDPFRLYDATQGYRPKFKLIPEPLLRGDGDVHASGGELFIWKESEEDSDE